MNDIKFYKGIKYKLFKNKENKYEGYVFVKKPFFKGELLRIDKSKDLILITLKNYIDDFIKTHPNFQKEEKASLGINKMSYDQDRVIREKLDATVDMASRKLNDWINTHGKKGTMGLLSDETKNEPTYKNLIRAYDTAKSNLDTFLRKTKYNTKYKKEILVEKVSIQLLPNGKKNIYYDPSSRYFNRELSKFEKASYDTEHYKKDPTIVSVYATKKVGGVEAFVIRKTGNNRYRYMGKLGAGSGDLESVRQSIISDLKHNKQATLIYGTDITKLTEHAFIIQSAFDDLTTESKKAYLAEHPNSKFANNRTPNSSEQKPKKKDNSEKIKNLEDRIKEKLDKIRELNNELDNPDLTPERKNKIHDRLDDLKDARKNLANQLFDLRT